jgi:hypothetical protein
MNKDIQYEIISYIIQPVYKMVDWAEKYFNMILSIDLIDNPENDLWFKLSLNNFSHDFLLEKYPDKIKWDSTIISNDYAVDFICENIDKVRKEALHLISDKRFTKYYENISKIPYYSRHFIDKIEKNIYKKSGLFSNKKRKKSEINVNCFLYNPEAYKIFEKYENEINWNELKKYSESFEFLKNPKSFPFFLRHQEKINSVYIFINPCVIEYAKKNVEKIDWNYISSNDNIIDFMFSNSNNKYILEYDIKKFDIGCLISNNNFVKFMIKNTFYYEEKEYNGKDFLLDIIDKYNYLFNITINKEAIPIIKDKYINATHLFDKCSLFLNPGIFEIDIDKTLKRYEKFIYNKQLFI